VSGVYVALGAALGAALRYLAGHLLDRSARLPWGTIMVNLAGSFLVGVLSALALSERPWAFLGVGFCGALTTYSAFAVQTVAQAAERGPRAGLLNVVLTVPPALALCALGFSLAR
jgi:fluoride exporter